MPLVDSLLTAVVRSDGDALVLHVGERPYVVASGGPVELSRQGLGLGAMEGMLAQLLSADALRVLREMGAVEHELEDRPPAAGDRFTVVAARGGDDIWIELRRHRRVAPSAAAQTAAPTHAMAAPVAATIEIPAAEAAEIAAPRVRDAAPPAIADDVPVPAAVPVVAEAAPAAVTVPVAETVPPLAAGTVGADDTAVAVPAPVAGATPVPTFEELEAAVESSFEPAVYVLPSLETELTAAMISGPVAAPAIEAASPEMAAAADERVAAVAAAADRSSSRPETAPDPVTEPEPPTMPAPVPEIAAVAVAFTPEPQPERPEPRPEAEPAVARASEPAPVPDVPAVVRRVPEPAPVAAVAAAPVHAPLAAASGDVETAGDAAPEAVALRALPERPAVTAVAVAPAALETPTTRTAEPSLAAEPSAPRTSWPTARFDAFVPDGAPEDADAQPVLPGLAPEYDALERHADARYDAPDALPAVVLSLTRDSARGNGGMPRGIARPGGIERLLRLAAARGASALYLTTQARPAVRVDGDIRLLDGEPALTSSDVEAAVLELAAEGAGEKESAEWIRDLQDVGRVRITTFSDYRGPGAILRMIQARATSAEQLGLVREIQALATEPEGLVLVTGPRASGKSTLMSAFVDLINRQRNDYVITLEGQIRLVHESRGSLISQRELRGNAGEVVAAARAALRENPDVLVIEDLRSPDVLQVALDAAGSGLLVFASVTAASATAALERLVDLCPAEQRHAVRAGLAEHLRGVVAQVLLRKAGGGRLAARELVLNTNAVAALVGDGQLAQLPRAIDNGRKLGMAPLNDALVAFVQSGAVDVREAYRKADDKAGLLALLKRQGIDTSFVERLA